MRQNPFQVLNDFFDHIYVITLKRATERQDRIREHLAGLDFHFFFGADKNELDIEQLKSARIYDEEKAKGIHRYNKPMTPGQIGCSRSHQLIYADIIQRGFSKVLILEDDVLPSKGLGAFSNVIEELPDDWELVYFDYHKNVEQSFAGKLKQQVYHAQKFLGALKWSHETIRNIYAKEYSPHLKKAGYHMYTSAYAVTLSGARKLLEMQTPLCYIADDLLAHAVSNGHVKGFIGIQKAFEQESQNDKSSGSFVED